MKEEVSRIMKMVQDGRLSPEDASELIEAMQNSEHEQAMGAEAVTGEPVDSNTENGSNGASHQYDANSNSGRDSSAGKDPFKALIDVVESFGREASQSIDFKAISTKMKSSAKEGAKAVMDAFKEASDHGFTFGLIETREIELPIFVPEGKSLLIENHCGQIECNGECEIGEVLATLKVKGGTEQDRKARAASFVLHIEETESEVIVRQGYFPNLSLSLKVNVAGTPQGVYKTDSSDISLKQLGPSKAETRSGNIELHEIHGALEASSVSGDIYGNVLEGQSTVESKSGDVKLEFVHNSLAARSTSGDVLVSNFHGQTSSLESVSGDIRCVEYGPIVGAANVRTVSGDVHMVITEGSDCMVALSTVSGDLACDVDAQDIAKSAQRLTGRLGDGKGTLDVSTVSGDISIESPLRQV